jgi:hypothetical protein
MKPRFVNQIPIEQPNIADKKFVRMIEYKTSLENREDLPTLAKRSDGNFVTTCFFVATGCSNFQSLKFSKFKKD